MNLNKRQVLLYGCLGVVVIGGAWFFFKPRPKPKVTLDLPPNTMYYTGPMKSKSGSYGPDTFFPELGTPAPNAATKK